MCFKTSPYHKRRKKSIEKPFIRKTKETLFNTCRFSCTLYEKCTQYRNEAIKIIKILCLCYFVRGNSMNKDTVYVFEKKIHNFWTFEFFLSLLGVGNSCEF